MPVKEAMSSALQYSNGMSSANWLEGGLVRSMLLVAHMVVYRKPFKRSKGVNRNSMEELQNLDGK